jgi:hypothetical protein
MGGRAGSAFSEDQTLRKLIALGITLAFLCSCTNQSKTPCERDRLFCGPSGEWEEKASRLPTPRVMQLQAINWDYYRPPDDAFVHILGKRGDEAILVLIQHLRANPRHRTPYFYRPLLNEVKFASGFDICGTAHIGSLERALTFDDGPSKLRKRAKRDLIKYCEDPLGVSWDD